MVDKIAQEIFDKNIGSNQELGYKPITNEDVMDCIKEALKYKKEKTTAEKLHEAYYVTSHVEEIIYDAFAKYEPENYEKLDFSIGSDEYDNSIEIYIKNVIPYPYEPCIEIRREIYNLGFSIVYWNFYDENGKLTEEIRGFEPRRLKEAPERSDAEFCKTVWEKWKLNGVDKRFNGDEWIGSKYDCRALQQEIIEKWKSKK